MTLAVKENVPLAPYTIYKIGGPARFFTEVKNGEDLAEALQFAAGKAVPYFILGAGSNVLVSDKGFGGLLVRMTGGEVRADGERLIADAGVMMARAVTESAKAGLGGFEWGIGIPGTIGGSVRGNAGCFGGQMQGVVERVMVFDSTRNIKYEMPNTECHFSYRDSIFKRHPERVILSAVLRLHTSDPAAVQAQVRRITGERLAKQDIGAKSCGCIFKNISWTRKDVDREKLLAEFPELAQFKDRPTIPASFLIDAAGLKGKQVGKVIISPKHANFFVNEGSATAEEVVMLTAIAKDTVRRTYGLRLEEEIQHVGFG